MTQRYGSVKPKKPPAAWLELSFVAAGLMVGMPAVMWAQRPDAGCTLSFEAPRVLVLSRETDREHLAADLASAARIAQRDMLFAEGASSPRDVQWDPIDRDRQPLRRFVV